MLLPSNKTSLRGWEEATVSGLARELIMLFQILFPTSVLSFKMLEMFVFDRSPSLPYLRQIIIRMPFCVLYRHYTSQPHNVNVLKRIQ